MIAKLAPQLSLMLQVEAEQNYDDTYRPHVEWANAKYQITGYIEMNLVDGSVRVVF